jgi:copper homeostasis protein
MTILIEACVDSVESALAAQRAGAGRIELCDNLGDGGTTPSAGMIAACKARLEIPVFVIVRPRGGDFVASEPELDVMQRDVEIARSLGAEGLVIGLLRPDTTVDRASITKLREKAHDVPITFHRAFDCCIDRVKALDDLIALGIHRVLTSGGARTAHEGVNEIATLVAQAGTRLTVMAGGGIRVANASEIVTQTGVREIHVRPTRLAESRQSQWNSAIRFRKPLSNDESRWDEIDPDHLTSLVQSVNGPFASLRPR